MSPDIQIFQTLRRHDVPFLIIGGHAVNFHGHIRATEDSDVIWQRSAESEIRLAAALHELEARYIGSDIDPATGLEREYPVTISYIQSRHLMMLWTRFGFLDLFDYVPGFEAVDVAEAFKTGIVNNGLMFTSLEWLRKMKQASGRPKDLEDLRKLED